MPLPVLFIIPATALMSSAGLGLSAKAGVDKYHANRLTADSNSRIEQAGLRLDERRKLCGEAISALGKEKLFILSHSIKRFVELFGKLKNVELKDSVGLEELENLHIDQIEFEALEKMSNFACSMGQGIAAGAAGGALTAMGAYGAATTFAAASTGTAISSLSGAAATNATLAFFGGGSLAAGGLGMAGGTVVLGGIVAGPALLIMGIITGARSGKDLENAKANAAKANEICEQFENGAIQCIAIRRRSNMFYNLLARLDAYLTQLNFKMEKIISEEGCDYSNFSCESKKLIACAASAATSVKAVLDTPILCENGELTGESENVANAVMGNIKKIELQ